MDNKEDRTSIDIKMLANCLRNEFEILHPLSDERCIYRVPQSRRQLNEGAYTPKIISIGPLHHGREEFKAGEEFKIRYLKDFLEGTSARMEEFLIFIKEREKSLRSCYAETIKIGSDDFVKMILLDSVFLIEVLLKESINSGTSLISAKQLNEKDIYRDLMLLENQLPLFILRDLFNIAKLERHGERDQKPSTKKLTCNLLKKTGEILLREDMFFERHFEGAKHFVELIRLCLQPSQSGNRKGKLKTLLTPTITELHQVGVEFKLGSSNQLLALRFKDGTLEIPKLTIVDKTEALFRNLQDFEALNCETNYVNDYISIMNYLVNSQKDVELLVQNGIIENGVSDNADVSTLFQNLQKESTVYIDNFSYTDLIEDLRAYCKSPWHKWKASLKQDYFNTPWASISVIAASILLILTLIQTICSILQVKDSSIS